MEKLVQKFEHIEIDKLIPYENNARTHSDEQIKKIQASLREFGFVNPVLIDKDCGIIAGHGRVEAAKREGMTEVPCVWVEHLTEAQKKGEAVAFIDAEHAFDPVYAKNIGLDIENLYISQPDFGEQALEILETLVRSSAFGVIVVDSVAALTPRAEIEGDMGDSHMGLQARLMSQALRKITAISSKAGTTIIFLNQLRMKIGIMFGNPETTTGGNALKFYASVRMDIRQKDKILKDGEVIGHSRKVKVVKNKVAPPFKEATFDMIYPMGIDKESSILDAAVQIKVVEKSGAWFKYGDTQLAQGKEATVQLLKEDKKLKEKIEKEVRAIMK